MVPGLKCLAQPSTAMPPAEAYDARGVARLATRVSAGRLQQPHAEWVAAQEVMWRPLLAAKEAKAAGFGPPCTSAGRKRLFSLKPNGSTGYRVLIFDYGAPTPTSLKRLVWMAQQDLRAIPEVNMLLRLHYTGRFKYELCMGEGPAHEDNLTCQRIGRGGAQIALVGDP